MPAPQPLFIPYKAPANISFAFADFETELYRKIRVTEAEHPIERHLPNFSWIEFVYG